MTIHTLYELVQHSVKSFASKVAFAMYGGEELSYAEVGTRVKHVQDLLIGAGLKAGDKVALLSSNMPNWPSPLPAWSPCRSCPISRPKSWR